MSQFKIIAYATHRYEMLLDAENAEEAIAKAEAFESVHPEWKEDVDFYNFHIDEVVIEQKKSED